MADLFTGREVVAYSQFRVTRNSDLWVDEEEVKNLRQALQSELHSRNYGFAVRLEVAAAARATWPTSCSTSSAIDRSRLFSVDGPVNLGRLLRSSTAMRGPS
jgi:polyphosphate kinase